MPRTGRPSLLTPERVETICKHLRAGSTLKDASLVAGDSVDTVFGWREKDPAVDAKISEAMAFARDAMARRVSAAAVGGDWKAAAWWLERRARDE